MKTLSGKDFVKLLPEPDQNSNGFNWIFQLGKKSNVINSMCRYLDSSNLLDEDEIETYLEWEANNTYEEMDIPPKTDYVWGTEEDNTVLDSEISTSQILINCLKNRAKQLTSLLETVREEFNSSQQKCEGAQKKFKLSQIGCRVSSSHLLNLHSVIAKDFEKWTISLSYGANQEKIPQYFAHCLLDDLRKDRKMCVKAMRSMLGSLAKEVAPKPIISNGKTLATLLDSKFRFIDGNQESLENLWIKTDLLVKKLLQVSVRLILRNIDHESILAANLVLKELLQKLRSGNYVAMSDDVSETTGELVDVVYYTRIEAIIYETEKKKIVDALMNKFSEECKSSEVQYNAKKFRLKEIAHIAEEQKNLNFLIGILYQLDGATVKYAEKLSHCFVDSLSNYVDQVTKKRIEPIVIKNEWSALSQPYTSYASQNAPICTLGVLIDSLTQANNEITAKQEEILHSIPCLLTYLTQKRQITNKLESFVISGATNKPVVIDYEYITGIQNHQIKYEIYFEQLAQAHASVEAMEIDRKQNPGFWMMRLIWVPFMNGNVERLEAIATGDFSLYASKQKSVGSHRKREGKYL